MYLRIKYLRDCIKEEKPDVVVLAAAKVGGINANQTMPAEFAYENMQIQCNVIKCCHDYKVKKLLFLGSTCIYPKMAPQPIPEDALLTGPLEQTNEAYAIAKISGLDMEDELTCLKCRVKDVEKVETYSKYNQSHPVPSLKITIEIYR